MTGGYLAPHEPGSLGEARLRAMGPPLTTRAPAADRAEFAHFSANAAARIFRDPVRTAELAVPGGWQPPPVWQRVLDGHDATDVGAWLSDDRWQEWRRAQGYDCW